MIYKLNTLGLALLAVLAMSAAVAPAASAATFTAAKYPTSVTATSPKGNDVFKTEGGNLECGSHLSGTLTEPASSITLTASYTECQAFGFSTATVIMGCDYVLSTAETLDIECLANNKIIIVAGTCEVQIGTQTGLSKVVLSNGSVDINAQANVSGIKYTVTKDGSGCPFAGTGEKTGGTYTQSSAATVSSTNGANIDIEQTPPVGEYEYTASSYPTTLTGQSALGNDTFITEAGKAECKGHYESTLSGATTSHMTVNVSITGCVSGFLSPTLDMNACDYTFEIPKQNSADVFSIPIEIICPAGKAIQVTVGGGATCEATIAPQTLGTGATIANDTAAGDLTVQLNMSGIKYTVTKDGFGCPYNGIGAKTGATYIQDAAMTMDSTNGATVDIG